MEIFEAVTDERLADVDIEWESGACVCVVLASGGYPLAYRKGEEIKIETTIEELNRDNEGYRYYGDVESDYVDIQEEVNNVMELINNDGSIDKLTYKTTPEEFANIYNEKYNASDLKDQTSIYHNLYGYDYFDLTVGIKYNQLVILPKYEQKWKESYWGNGYWDKELSGYYYNPDAISDTFYLNFIPKEKLKDKGKQVLDLVCQYLTEKGYTKLSTDDNNNEHISIFWEKKSPFIIKAGVHFYPKDNRIGIAIGKDK